jgi:hypothetical protein
MRSEPENASPPLQFRAEPRVSGSVAIREHFQETKAVTSYSDRDTERSDLRQAYELGRKDARKQRRRHPILMTFTVIAAAVGLIIMALAAVNGSFGGAGTVVDQNLATAADQAEPVVRGAAADAGQAVRNVTTTDGTQTPAPN